jgi:hypothetical protein
METMRKIPSCLLFLSIVLLGKNIYHGQGSPVPYADFLSAKDVITLKWNGMEWNPV